MASYSDYVKKEEDNLEAEIKDADQQTRDRQSADNLMPDKFKGKSAEEIAASYLELEKAHSQQGSTLGQMRKALDDQILAMTKVEEKTTPQEATPISLDEMYDDPDGVVRKVVQQETDARIQELEKRLAETVAANSVADLTRRHPNWETDAGSPEFQKWVDSSPVLSRMSQIVRETQDVGMAGDMMDEYYASRKQSQNTQDTAQRERDLATATLESGGTEAHHTEQTFSRTELTNIRVAAKRGNAEAQDWLKAHRDAIAVAYETGHITD